MLWGGPRRVGRTRHLPVAGVAAVPMDSELMLVGGLAGVCLLLAVQGTLSRRAGT